MVSARQGNGGHPGPRCPDPGGGSDADWRALYTSSSGRRARGRRTRRSGELVIHELKRLQATHGYLSRPALEALSAERRIPLDELYGVASFYPHFRFAPRAGPEIAVCRDLPCRLAGAERLARDLQGTGNGLPSGAGPVSVRRVSCVGLCDTAPAVGLDDAVYTHVPAGGAGALLAAVAERREPGVTAAPPPPFAFAGPDATDPETYDFGVLRRVADMAAADRAQVIAALKASGLRGLGGAGFPASAKWSIVAGATADRKYAVCNADESEPGTFKDRALLEGVPHLVLEGLLIGALVVGASDAIVYLRHEYRRALALLEATIRRLESLGLAGEGSRTGVRLEVFESPGGYICGEETALLEALEGKRAEPRNRPPYPGTHGLHGRPTLVKNVETLVFASRLLRFGPDWYRSAGPGQSAARKLLALSGDVARPGVYEVWLGITAEELIERYGGGVAGGRRLKAFSPGGPSSGFLPASMSGVPLDFEPLQRAGSMLGSGAVVVLAEGRCLLDAARSYVDFFTAESCGKCVPCRVGTEKLSARLAGWAAGQAPGGDDPAGMAAERALVEDLALTMGQASICGLGQVAALPITSGLAHFRDEVEAHVVRGRCPEGVCTGAR